MNEKRLVILIDAHVFDNEHQGSKTYIRGIYRELIKNKNIVFHFAARNISELAGVFGHQENVRYVKLKSDSSTMRLLFEFPRIILRLKPDYAHFQYIVPPIKFCKYVVTTHDVLFLDFPEDFPYSHRIVKRFLYKIAIRQSDIVTTVSEYSKERIASHFGEQLDRLHVTSNGISGEYFDEYDKNIAQRYINEKYEVENYLLCVSRIEPRKQQNLILRLFIEEELHKKGVKLVFVGHVSLADPLINELYNPLPESIKESIHFFNNISDEDLIQFYKAALAFLYPSKAEGFGIPPLEAGALKIPVLCSNATAMGDFDFFREFHVDPNDHETIHAKINEIINSPLDESGLTVISYKIKNKYSWKVPANKLYNLLIKNY